MISAGRKRYHPQLPRAATFVVGVVLLCVSACSSSTHAVAPQSPTPTATLPAAYHATQWEVAYLDKSAHVHAVGLDGAHDEPLIAFTDQIFSKPELAHIRFFIDTINPDGHTLSYGETTLHLSDLRQKDADRSVATHTVIADGAWSPDGTQEIVTDDTNNFYLLQTADAAFRPLAGNPYPNRRLLGWLDATHVAVGQGMAFADPNDPNADGYVIDTIDITSGADHRIAMLKMPHLGIPDGKLAPDRQHVLLYNSPWQDTPFTPVVGVFDLHAGTFHQFPTITQQTGSFLTSLAWGPDSQTVIATTGLQATNNLQAWMLHLDSDTAVKTTTPGYIFAWNAQTNTILTSTAITTSRQDGPFTITALHVQPGDTFKTTILATQAYSAPVIGFIPPQPRSKVEDGCRETGIMWV